jgi:LuxR family maltose regulon positive regulatory protein
VRRTLASGDLDAIEDLFDALWYWLPTYFSREVLDTAGELDHAAFARRPRLLHLTLLAHHRQEYAGVDDRELTKLLAFYSSQGRRYADRLTEFTHPSELQTAGTIAMISARLDGAYRRSEQLGIWVEQRLHMLDDPRPMPWTDDHVRAKPGWHTTQRGVTATLSGDLDQAIQLFTRAVAEAGSPPGAHFAGANAAANLALISAVRGQFDLAHRWIERTERAGPLPDWVEHLTTIGAKIARALIATEECQPELARDYLEAVGPTTQPVELWPFVVYAWANYHATFGDPHRGLADLDAARLAHGFISGAEYGFSGEVLLRAEAELLLSTEQAARVFNVARLDPGRYPQKYTARSQLLVGRPLQAIRTAVRSLRKDGSRAPLNDLIDLQLTLALAYLRTGDAERAATAFAAAVRLRSTTTHLKPFLGTSRDDIATLAALAGVPDPLLDLPEPPRDHPPRRIDAVDLTRREAEVLGALETGRTAAEVAKGFGVSVHTVRSQIASAYRKLGVSSREAALTRAHELGLLSPHSERAANL